MFIDNKRFSCIMKSKSRKDKDVILDIMSFLFCI